MVWKPTNLLHFEPKVLGSNCKWNKNFWKKEDAFIESYWVDRKCGKWKKQKYDLHEIGKRDAKWHNVIFVANLNNIGTRVEFIIQCWTV